MPGLTSDVPTVLLPYLHYSVLLRPDRRFAALTALVMDGACLRSIDREDDWVLDPRLAAELQAGPHGLRPQRPRPRSSRDARVVDVGGDQGGGPAGARSTPSSSPTPRPRPRCSTRARSSGWASRSYLMSTPATSTASSSSCRRPGPRPGRPAVPGDPGAAAVLEGRGVRPGRRPGGHRLPARPVAAGRRPRRVALEEAAAAGEPPPLGAYRTFQVPIADIAMLAGVRLDQLVAVDRLPAPPAEAPPAPGQPAGGWVELQTLDDVRL